MAKRNSSLIALQDLNLSHMRILEKVKEGSTKSRKETIKEGVTTIKEKSILYIAPCRDITGAWPKPLNPALLATHLRVVVFGLSFLP